MQQFPQKAKTLLANHDAIFTINNNNNSRTDQAKLIQSSFEGFAVNILFDKNYIIE